MAIGDKKPVLLQEDIGADGGVPPYLHASQHSASGSDPITPAAINALSVRNSYFAGNVDDLLEGVWLVLPAATGAMAWTDAWYTLVAFPTYTGSNIQIACRSMNPGLPAPFKYRHFDDNGWGPWSELATTDYAVNKAGDTMMGDLKLNGGQMVEIRRITTGERTARFQQLGSQDVNVVNFLDDSNYTALRIDKESEALATILRLTRKVNGTTAYYNIFHTGDKPSGTYTGNGDATARTINTGGIGDTVIIYSANGVVIVTPNGAICASGTSASGLASTSIKFASGVLTLATTDSKVNTSGTTYYYQVL